MAIERRSETAVPSGKSSSGKVSSGRSGSSDEGVSVRGSFIRESWAELRKVSPPSRQETIQATVVTIFMVAVMSVCLFLVDQIFHTLMKTILG